MPVTEAAIPHGLYPDADPRDVVCLFGVVILAIGVMKEVCELDDKYRRFMMWSSGIVICISTRLMQYSPDTTFHILCNIGCAVGLGLCFTGALIDLVLCSCDRDRRGKAGEMMMMLGIIISTASNVAEGLVYLYEYLSSVRL